MSGTKPTAAHNVQSTGRVEAVSDSWNGSRKAPCALSPASAGLLEDTRETSARRLHRRPRRPPAQHVQVVVAPAGR